MNLIGANNREREEDENDVRKNMYTDYGISSKSGKVPKLVNTIKAIQISLPR